MATSGSRPESYIGNDLDDDLNDEANGQPICLMAEDCNELFNEYLKRSVASHGQPPHLQFSHMIKEYHHRFDGWCTFLGVFTGGNAALDYRLRRHAALQDMIIRMLDMLRQNLFLGKRTYASSRERSQQN
jgi:hypothetical protein